MSQIQTAVTGLALLTTSSLSSANATISATIPSGYRYLRVVLYGVTTAAIATTVKLTINGSNTTYYTRILRATVATFNTTSATDSVILLSDNTGCTLFSAIVDIECPSGVGKRYFTKINCTDGSTTDYEGFGGGMSSHTAEITSIEVVVAGTTWTTATKMYVLGTK